MRKIAENLHIIYSIQGNIGSGKSTLLSILKQKIPKIQIIPEPVSEWQNISSLNSKEHNLLEQYYKDPKRWGFTFQINAILSRMTQLKNIMQKMERESSQKQGKVYYSERSVVADRQIFAKLLSMEGKMSPMEHILYEKMYNSLDSLFQTPRIHKFIYLKVSPQKCFERIRKRARNQQNTIPLEYLKKIHNLHEQWLYKNVDSKNVLTIRAEEQFQSDQQVCHEHVQKAAQFLA